MVEHTKINKRQLNVCSSTVLIRDAGRGIPDLPVLFVGWSIDFLPFLQLRMFTE